MKKQITFGFLTGVLAISLIGCNPNNSSDATSPNRPQPNQNTRTATPVDVNATNANELHNTKADTQTADTDFLAKATQGGMIEVELGKIAVAKAVNPEVKNFAQKMIDDHSKANNELKELSFKKNFKQPIEVNSEQKSLMEKLNGLSGAAFDKAYVDAMVDDHQDDIDLFEDESEGGKDADVKAWAAKTLPTLRAHFEMIKGIESKMK